MSSHFRLILLIVVTAVSSGYATRAWSEIVITENDTWRYWKGRSTPPDQDGIPWTHSNYDDDRWAGPASGSFGYGYRDNVNVLSDMQHHYLSLFLRTRFPVAAPDRISRLTLAVDYDDAFVAYLNGVELTRRNLPSGKIDHATQALSEREASRGNGNSNPQEREFISLNPDLLVDGDNVLAISTHNASASSTDFYLRAELFTGINLVRGPYLQLPENTGVTVVWYTDTLSSSEIDWGTDLSYRGGSATDATPRRKHVVHVSGLKDGVDYYYRIRSDGEILSEGNVLTTRRRADQPYRFVVYGDFGWYHEPAKAIAHQVNRSKAHLQLTVGDNVYLEGQPGHYDLFWFKRYAPLLRTAPLMPAIGNHDQITANGYWFTEYLHLPQNGPRRPSGLLEKNYSFEYANAHFSIIDTEPFERNQHDEIEAIRNWLRHDLHVTRQPWKFVLLHRPPYTSVGRHDGHERVRERLTPIFERAGVKVVFQGHNHFYERIRPINGVRYITSGGGGHHLYPVSRRKPYSARLVNDRHTFVQVDVKGSQLWLRAIDASGRVVDETFMDISSPFVMDGVLDNADWLRAANGLRLYLAIRGNTMYVATQDAGEGNDHFIYVNRNPSFELQAANWKKSGKVSAWTAFLADENYGGFVGWFDKHEHIITKPMHFRAETPGIDDNDPYGNGVLEGSVDLVKLFGEIPEQITVAAEAFDSDDLGALVAQVPAGNGDVHIQGDEFLTINTHDLLVDLEHLGQHR